MQYTPDEITKVVWQFELSDINLEPNDRIGEATPEEWNDFVEHYNQDSGLIAERGNHEYHWSRIQDSLREAFVYFLEEKQRLESEEQEEALVS